MGRFKSKGTTTGTTEADAFPELGRPDEVDDVQPAPELIVSKKKKYTLEEELKLKEAIKDYMADTGKTREEIYDIVELARCEKKGNSLFFKSVASALPHRKYNSVYEHIIRKLHRGNCQKWEESDIRHLLELVAKMGHQWGKISRILERPKWNVRDVYRRYVVEGKQVKGKWTTEEESRLAEAIMKERPNWRVVDGRILDTGGKLLSVEDVRGLPWKEISKFVGSRSAFQCRCHWFAVKFDTQNRMIMSKEDDLKLIQKLKSLDYDCESDVNWNEVDPYRYSNMLQTRFYTIKHLLPNNRLLEWNQLLDGLEAILSH